MTQDEKKQALWKLVDQRRGELLEICSDLIRIPSVDEAGIEEILQYACTFLDKLNISYEVLRPAGDVPCIAAELGADTGKTGILNGHNDVVSPGDVSRWSYAPFCGAITDTQVLGRGASDMKCGTGVLLFLLKLIVEENLRPRGKVRLHLVHDEERGGEQGSKWLTEHGYADGADFCIVTEPTSSDYIEVGQKSRARLRLRTHGKPVNGSIINYVGESAIHNMIRVLSRVKALSQLEGEIRPQDREVIANSKQVICRAMGLTDVGDAVDHINVNVLRVDGGSGSTMTSETCEAVVALGVPCFLSREQVHRRLMELIEESGAACDVEYLAWQDGASTDSDSPLVRSVRENAEQITGRTIVPAYQWATSDAKYSRYLGIPTIQFGPANSRGIHSYDEDVEIVDIIKCAKTHLAVLEDLIGFDAFAS